SDEGHGILDVNIQNLVFPSPALGMGNLVGINYIWIKENIIMNNHKNDKGDTIIFDLDGTLFQTETVAVPAFYRMYQRLEDQGMYWGSPPAKSRIESVFGMIAPDIWEQLLPGASEEVKQAADEGWLQEELSCLSEGLGALYPGVSRGLRELKRREW